MKAYTKLGYLGMASGLLFFFASVMRYFIIYPDWDRAIVYSIIGGLISAVAFLYDRQRNIINTIDYIETWMQDNLTKQGR